MSKKTVEPEAPVAKTVRTTEYTLSEAEATEAIIQYLRQRGFHAPDQTKARYNLFQHHMYHSHGTIDVKWEEDVP